MRLMGLNDLGEKLGRLPAFGMKTTLTCLQTLGIYLRVKLALKIPVRCGSSASIPCCNSAGKIPSPPGVLKGLKVLIANLIFLGVKILPERLLILLREDGAVSTHPPRSWSSSVKIQETRKIRATRKVSVQQKLECMFFVRGVTPIISFKHANAV